MATKFPVGNHSGLSQVSLLQLNQPRSAELSQNFTIARGGHFIPLSASVEIRPHLLKLEPHIYVYFNVLDQKRLFDKWSAICVKWDFTDISFCMESSAGLSGDWPQQME